MHNSHISNQLDYENSQNPDDKRMEEVPNNELIFHIYLQEFLNIQLPNKTKLPPPISDCKNHSIFDGRKNILVKDNKLKQLTERVRQTKSSNFLNNKQSNNKKLMNMNNNMLHDIENVLSLQSQ